MYTKLSNREAEASKILTSIPNEHPPMSKHPFEVLRTAIASASQKNPWHVRAVEIHLHTWCDTAYGRMEVP